MNNPKIKTGVFDLTGAIAVKRNIKQGTTNRKELQWLPPINSTWDYKAEPLRNNPVLLTNIVNLNTKIPDHYPVTVIYRNLNGKHEAKPLSNFLEDMRRI